MLILVTYETLPLPFGKSLEVGNRRGGYSNRYSEARINSATLCNAHNIFALQHIILHKHESFYFINQNFILT
jgi:hypothetical protein